MKFDITVNDPLLEPFLPVIRRRHERSVLKELEFTNRKKKLADIFNNHLYFGLHRLPGKGWVFREWAPHATAIYLIGESNDCNEGRILASTGWREGFGNWNYPKKPSGMGWITSSG